MIEVTDIGSITSILDPWILGDFLPNAQKITTKKTLPELK
jgi:hypothetical protein